MGCASSTPMVTSAGSEFLKTASHVAADATKTAEGAVQDVADAVGKSIDTAKDAVGTKVAGIANDLSHALKEKTDAIDDVKNQLIDKLHPHDDQQQQEENSKKLNHIEMSNAAMTTIEEHISRPPTPAALLDADSLKTSTPEPEIEQALANCADDDSPPTPIPTLSELEQLTAAVEETLGKSMNESFNKTNLTDADANVLAAVDKILKNEQAHRPGTTDWERYADTLASSRKYVPADGFRRASRFMPQTQPYTQNSAFFPKVAGPNVRRQNSWLSDHNTNSHNSPMHSTQSSPNDFSRKALPNNLPASHVRQFQREFASLVSNDKAENSKQSNKKTTTTTTTTKTTATAPTTARGRKFDFNTQRSRVHLPSASASGTATGTATAIGTATTTPIATARTLSRMHSPIQRDNGHWPLSRSNTQIHKSLVDHAHTPDGVRSYSHVNSPFHSRNIVARSTVVTPINNLSIESSDTASTCSSDCVVIKTGLLSSSSSSPIKLTLRNDVPSRLGARTPTLIINTSASASSSSHNILSPIGEKHKNPMSATSRLSPFSTRHSTTNTSEKENKFNTDLSSVTERRTSVVKSPYKVRQRCAVCYNKYLVK